MSAFLEPLKKIITIGERSEKREREKERGADGVRKVYTYTYPFENDSLIESTRKCGPLAAVTHRVTTSTWGLQNFTQRKVRPTRLLRGNAGRKFFTSLSRLKTIEAKGNKLHPKRNLICIYTHYIRIYFICLFTSTDCDPTMSSSLSNSSEAAPARQPTKSMFLQFNAVMCLVTPPFGCNYTI